MSTQENSKATLRLGSTQSLGRSLFSQQTSMRLNVSGAMSSNPSSSATLPTQVLQAAGSSWFCWFKITKSKTSQPKTSFLWKIPIKRQSQRQLRNTLNLISSNNQYSHWIMIGTEEGLKQSLNSTMFWLRTTWTASEIFRSNKSESSSYLIWILTHGHLRKPFSCSGQEVTLML